MAISRAPTLTKKREPQNTRNITTAKRSNSAPYVVTTHHAESMRRPSHCEDYSVPTFRSRHRDGPLYGADTSRLSRVAGDLIRVAAKSLTVDRRGIVLRNPVPSAPPEIGNLRLRCRRKSVETD